MRRSGNQVSGPLDQHFGDPRMQLSVPAPEHHGIGGVLHQRVQARMGGRTDCLPFKIGTILDKARRSRQVTATRHSGNEGGNP
jgi:hypothetical protein